MTPTQEHDLVALIIVPLILYAAFRSEGSFGFRKDLRQTAVALGAAAMVLGGELGVVGSMIGAGGGLLLLLLCSRFDTIRVLQIAFSAFVLVLLALHWMGVFQR